MVSMGRMTKQAAREYTYVYFGINRDTWQVETAYQTRGGTLELWRDDVRLTAPLGMGRMAESECRIVFGMADVRWLPISQQDSETAKRWLDELKAKAAKMKDERIS